jgi:hypothetical protein
VRYRSPSNRVLDGRRLARAAPMKSRRIFSVDSQPASRRIGAARGSYSQCPQTPLHRACGPLDELQAIDQSVATMPARVRCSGLHRCEDARYRPLEGSCGYAGEAPRARYRERRPPRTRKLRAPSLQTSRPVNTPPTRAGTGKNASLKSPSNPYQIPPHSRCDRRAQIPCLSLAVKKIFIHDF